MRRARRSVLRAKSHNDLIYSVVYVTAAGSALRSLGEPSPL